MRNDTPHFTKRLALWGSVCAVSAAPSFLLAASKYDPIAMLVGVAFFALGMTWCTGRPGFMRFKRRPFVRTTLYIGYVTRVVISVLWPIGASTDIMCGVFSIGIIEEGLGMNGASFIGTLLITLIQGTFLNIILFVFMSIVYGVQRLVRKMPKNAFSWCCSQCGYDLRGQTEARCPECGRPFFRRVLHDAPDPYNTVHPT